MTAELTGRPLSARLRESVTAEAARLTAAGVPPRLAVVVATEDESSAWYVRSIVRAAEKSGITCTVVDLGPTASAEEIRAALAGLSADPGVHGVVLQTPLPPDVVFDDLAAAIDPAKDVDGANPLSLGRLVAGLPAFAPATAEAVVALLEAHAVPLAGATAVVVGRSTVVGKPLAHLLLQRDATVTVCHSRTKELARVTRTADVLVAAVGRPGLLTAEHVVETTVVVDVGTTPTADGGLAGDVDAASVTGRVAALSPVPGGVGPVTTALLCSTRCRPRRGPPTVTLTRADPRPRTPSRPAVHPVAELLHRGRPLVCGILNVTPDSFSDGGRFLHVDQAVEHGLRLAAEGADLIDVGGESTRPGARPTTAGEELDRVVPVVAALAGQVSVPLSVDTSRPEVMRAAVAAGAGMVNDVRALRRPGALTAVSDLGVPVCLMHMQGSPGSMQRAPVYTDAVAEVRGFLAERLDACRRAGIPQEHLLVDPGFGFGKALAHNLALLAGLPHLQTLGVPVLVGVSRKSMLGELTGRAVPDRLAGSLAAAVLAVERGARVLRVHDVAATCDALAVMTAVSAVDGG